MVGPLFLYQKKCNYKVTFSTFSDKNSFCNSKKVHRRIWFLEVLGRQTNQDTCQKRGFGRFKVLHEDMSVSYQHSRVQSIWLKKRKQKNCVRTMRSTMPRILDDVPCRKMPRFNPKTAYRQISGSPFDGLLDMELWKTYTVTQSCPEVWIFKKVIIKEWIALAPKLVYYSTESWPSRGCRAKHIAR